MPTDTAVCAFSSARSAWMPYTRSVSAAARNTAAGRLRDHVRDGGPVTSPMYRARPLSEGSRCARRPTRNGSGTGTAHRARTVPTAGRSAGTAPCNGRPVTALPSLLATPLPPYEHAFGRPKSPPWSRPERAPERPPSAARPACRTPTRTDPGQSAPRPDNENTISGHDFCLELKTSREFSVYFKRPLNALPAGRISAVTATAVVPRPPP